MKKLIILTFFIKIFLRKLMLYGSYSINSNCFSLFLFLKPFSRPVRTLCYLKKLKENWILRQKVYSHFHVSGMSKDIHQSLRLRGVDWVGYYKTMELSFCHELLFSIISLQQYAVNLWYIKLWILFDQIIIVYIKGLL